MAARTSQLPIKFPTGHKIAQIRINKNMKQLALAMDSNISDVYLCRIERGFAKPSYDVISRICKALNITSKDLD